MDISFFGTEELRCLMKEIEEELKSREEKSERLLPIDFLQSKREGIYTVRIADPMTIARTAQAAKGLSWNAERAARNSVIFPAQ